MDPKHYEGVWLSNALPMRSILRQSRDKSNGCGEVKKIFQKRISNNLNSMLRSVLKNIHFGLY